MSEMQLSSCARASGLAFAVVSVLSSVLVVLKERNEALLAFMKNLTVHHWVTHGLFDVVLFVLLGLIFGKMRQGQGPAVGDNCLVNIVIAGAVVGAAIIYGFYGFFD